MPRLHECESRQLRLNAPLNQDAQNLFQILSGLVTSGFKFLSGACNEAGFLEDVSGLARLKSARLDMGGGTCSATTTTASSPLRAWKKSTLLPVN